MDPIKIAIFLAAFGLLLVIGRVLSSSSEVHAAALPASQPDNPIAPGEAADGERAQPALVGSEIEFPIQIPPVERLRDGTFNRPIIANYYFAHTDLVRGPTDPNSFVDQLTLQAQDPGTGELWAYQYTVATPAGLRQYLDEKHFDSLYLGAKVVIVARWDLGLVLQTVIDQIMEDTAAEVRDGDEQAAANQEFK